MDWKDRLIELERLSKSKEIPLDDYMHFLRESLNLCSQWDTCAIGENQHELRLKGFKFGKIDDAPLDRELFSKGVDFDEAMNREDYETASEIYQDILNY